MVYEFVILREDIGYSGSGDLGEISLFFEGDTVDDLITNLLDSLQDLEYPDRPFRFQIPESEKIYFPLSVFDRLQKVVLL